VRVLYHDQLFRWYWPPSAAFFPLDYEGQYSPDATFEFKKKNRLAHKAAQLFEASLFDGGRDALGF